MKIFIWLIMILPFLASAQEKPGIHFAQTLSWQQVRAKAREENKYIFVDAYASWCGPCKMMEADIYPDSNVGKEFDANFISYKLQMDSTTRDNEGIKAHYGDSHDFQQQYPINAYPSFFFFSPDGKLVHIGLGYRSPADFIELARNARDPSRQNYPLIDAYRQGKIAPDQCKTVADVAQQIGDGKIARKAANEYIRFLMEGRQDSLYTYDHIEFIAQYTTHHDDPGFGLFSKHAAGINALMKKNTYSGDIIDRIIIAEEITPHKDELKDSAAWADLQKKLARKYDATMADRASTKARIFQSYDHDWTAFTKALVHYTDSYEDQDDDQILDRNARYVSQHTTDRSQLQRALAWSGKVVGREPSNADYTKTHDEIKAKLAAL